MPLIFLFSSFRNSPVLRYQENCPQKEKKNSGQDSRQRDVFFALCRRKRKNGTPDLVRRRCERGGEGQGRLIRPSGALLILISSLYYQHFILEGNRLKTCSLSFLHETLGLFLKWIRYRSTLKTSLSGAALANEGRWSSHDNFMLASPTQYVQTVKNILNIHPFFSRSL